jgi:serine/threonine-protein kinase
MSPEIAALQGEVFRLEPGARLDRYRLLVEIATGGMGSVWLAQMEGKHGFQKLVAIKTILKRFAESESFKRMFLNEATIAARIDHPNVARILELGEANGLVFIVMEWVDGAGLDELRRRVRQGGTLLPLAISLRIVADVASGLHAAHELVGADGALMQVVHRDISPNNVLISRFGVPKVIDFGVAKADNGGLAPNTTFGTLKGKLRYMAPEQALGVVAIDRRADIWALGVVLYELVEGRGLHEGFSDMAILGRLTTGFEPPAFSSELPPPVAEILRRCLAARPHERFATAAELRNALEDTAAALSLRARTEDVAALLRNVLGREMDARRTAYERAARTFVPSTKTEVATPAGLRAESLELPIDFSERGGTSSSISPNVIEIGVRPPRRLRVAAGVGLVGVLVAGALILHARGGREAMAASPLSSDPVTTSAASLQPPSEPPAPSEIKPNRDVPATPPAASSEPRTRMTTATPPVSAGLKTRIQDPVKKVVSIPKQAPSPPPVQKSSSLEREAESSWRSKEEL